MDSAFLGFALCMVVICCDLTSAVLLDEAQWIDVSRCRARCLDKLLAAPVSDTKCTEDKDCHVCWELCERQSVPEWKSLCTPSTESICRAGCRTACSLPKAVQRSDVTDYQFRSSPVVRETSEDQLLMNWTPLVTSSTAKSNEEQSTVIVFTLFWRDENNRNWGHVCTTSAMSARVTGPHKSFPGLAFKLIAITESGIIAETFPPYPPETGDEEYGYYYYYYYEDEEDEEHSEKVTPEDPLSKLKDDYEVYSDEDHDNYYETSTALLQTEAPSVERLDLDISVTIISVPGEALRLALSWRQPETEEIPYFTVSVRKQDCTHPDVRYCNDSVQEQNVTASLTAGSKIDAIVTGIKYNARYSLDISFNRRRNQRLHFITPTCKLHISNMTVCLEKAAVDPHERQFPATATGSLRPSQTTFTTYILLGTCAALVIVVVVVMALLMRRNQRMQKSLLRGLKAVRIDRQVTSTPNGRDDHGTEKPTESLNTDMTSLTSSGLASSSDDIIVPVNPECDSLIHSLGGPKIVIGDIERLESYEA